jgi:ATP-dependent RNA helicase DDX10/DBP4
MKQTTRLTTCTRFTQTKHAVLLATDIAARGLDFPSVDWVVQVDAPEDADTYIHRVGRTARYESTGHGLLLLCPSEEEGMLKALEKKGVKIAKIKIRESKTQSIENQLQNLAFRDPEIKYLGQRVRALRLRRRSHMLTLAFFPGVRLVHALSLPP